jgi:hypothetical protein
MGLLGGLMTLLWSYASHDYRLISTATSRAFVSHTLWRSAAAPVVFIASIPIAFASPTAAEWSWLLLLVIRIVLRRRYRTIFGGEPRVQ